jgi:hypothetical protein
VAHAAAKKTRIADLQFLSIVDVHHLDKLDIAGW